MKMCLDWCIYKDNIFVYIMCVCKFKIYTCKGERTFTGWWQRRDRVGNYSNIFAIISKYLQQTTQPYFTLSEDGRQHKRKWMRHKVLWIQYVFAIMIIRLIFGIQNYFSRNGSVFNMFRPRSDCVCAFFLVYLYCHPLLTAAIIKYSNFWPSEGWRVTFVFSVHLISIFCLFMYFHVYLYPCVSLYLCRMVPCRQAWV